MKNGLENYFVIKDNKKMRFGYTTGSSAAAAAKAAAEMLFSGKDVPVVELLTPNGITLYLEVLDAKCGQKSCSCAIQKDGGDDPDVTSGLRIYANVTLCERQEAEIICQKYQRSAKADLQDTSKGVAAAAVDGKKDRQQAWIEECDNDKKYVAVVGITAGEGVGIVTLPGLEQPVGAPAINRVPREMITKEVQAVCEKYHYTEGVEVCISVPNGAVVAEKTFNPRLGIQGGISILGTSGIVEPMSEQALISSIQVEMKQKATGDRKYLLIAPGNYGLQYLSGNFPFEAEEAVKCSNYVGQTIDFAVNMGLKGVLFVAHIGKFIKVAGGIMNTHSREADARLEIMTACALRAGADADTANRILAAVTTDEGLSILKETPYWAQTMQIITEKVEYYLNHRAQERLEIGAVLYSNAHGELGRTSLVEKLLEQLQQQKL